MRTSSFSIVVAIALLASIGAAVGQDKAPAQSVPDSKTLKLPDFHTQVPVVPGICEGSVYPDCPAGCDADANNKKCTPKAVAVEPQPRRPGG